MELLLKKRLFEEVYRTNLLKIVFFAQHYLGNKEEAECVAHEVFITLWDKLHVIDISKDLLPYLITITKNKCLNIIKSRKVKEKFNQQGKAILGFDSVHCMALEDSMNKLYADDLETIINKSLFRMTKTVRETFILSRFKKMSYKEISNILGISPKAVEYRMMSALRVLRKNCKDFL